MAKYEVIRAWFGVSTGDVVEIEELHPALKSNVRELKGQVVEDDEITNGDPINWKKRKGDIAKRLKELSIEFNGSLGGENLAKLLPDGELEALFPEE